MSPPLIREVKKRRDPNRVTILDAPPGTSCPVIQTVKGSDFTVLVTEPTPFGLYDLKLAVEVLDRLRIPCGVVINRADVGDRKVKDYLKARGLPLLLEIPFDRRIAAGYARGQSLIEIRPELKADMQNLFREIQGLLKETPQVRYALP
jgi:MinD superfamily P-loop ATPase